MDDKLVKPDAIRARAAAHPWWCATVGAFIIILVGLASDLFTNQPVNWPRTVGIGIVLGVALGAQVKAAQRRHRRPPRWPS